MSDSSIFKKDWLKDLKPGDKVIVASLGQKSTVQTVKSVGKKIISLVDYSLRFNIETGYRCSSDNYYHKHELKKATPEAIKRIEKIEEKAKLIKQIELIDLNKVSLSTLREINSLLDNSGGGTDD